MSGKKFIWGGMVVGSTLGGFAPLLWGGDAGLSFSSIILTAVGGIVGIFIAYKLAQTMGIL